MRRQLPAHSPLSLPALLSGAAGALGRRDHAALDSAIREYWGSRDTALTNSGTVALSLAISAALRDPNGTVALPAYGCYDLASAADGANARVVLYDLDPGTLTPNRESLLRALAHKPAALVLVHLYGVPVDVQAIARLAAAADTLIIEDAAQGIGAAVRGEPVGALGSVSVLSFGRGKGLTGGAGGALLANDERGELIVRQVRARLHNGAAGWSDLVRAAALWLLARPSIYAVPAALPFLRLGQTLYHPPQEPRPLPRAAASVLTRIWTTAHEAAKTRQANARRLVASLVAASPCENIEITAGNDAGFLRMPVLVKPESRSRFVDSAAAALGIVQGYPLTLDKLTEFQHRVVNIADGFPGAAALAQRLFTLPTHTLLSEADLAGLESFLRNAISFEKLAQIPDARVTRAMG
ncbi:MAG: DegT/DnrJ/EryC1/StrS family aminotransferase [Gemmatimonadota bacterium]